MSVKATVLKIHGDDNVGVALQNLSKGDEVMLEGSPVLIQSSVTAKHKFALHDLGENDEVIMYGVLVGRATRAIRRGEVLTTENIKHAVGGLRSWNGKRDWQTPEVSGWKNRTFMGYHRADGSVGTANYWVVIPLVFCENRNVNILRTAFEKALGYAQPDHYTRQVETLIGNYKKGAKSEELLNMPPYSTKKTDSREGLVFENVTGIKFLTHEGGCGGTRQDSELLCKVLAGYINNPNVAGATVLSLGCQNAQVPVLEEALRQINPGFSKPLYIFEQQKSGTEEKMISDAINHTFVGMAEANKIKRSPAPLSKLSIGVECGGSDGFSGISANPAMGYCSDLMAALGGAAILSEFPELCGVEQEIIDRCDNAELAERFESLMKVYAKRAEEAGSGFDMNPSPGNIKDGLITDAIKSAGAAKKGGTSPVKGVLDYGEYVTAPGLNLLCTPGNDVESTTGLAGSGANIILFSTGLGTPTGNPVTPVIKVSSNTTLAQKMADIIDFDAGPVISGEKTIEQSGEELMELIIRTASGEYTTKAALLGQDDFIPWKRGVSL